MVSGGTERMGGAVAVKLAASALAGKQREAFSAAWEESGGNLAGAAIALAVPLPAASTRAYFYGFTRADDPRVSAVVGTLGPMIGEDPGMLARVVQHDAAPKVSAPEAARSAALALSAFEASREGRDEKGLFSKVRAVRLSLERSGTDEAADRLAKAAPVLEDAALRTPSGSSLQADLLRSCSQAVGCALEVVEARREPRRKESDVREG